MSPRKAMRVFIKSAAVAVPAGTAVIAYYYRPTGDPTIDSDGPRRSDGFLISKTNLCDHANKPAPLLYQWAANTTIFTMNCVSRLFLYRLGKFEVQTDDKYNNFVARVVGRDPGVPLITVSNHRSMLDDPFVMASVLPFRISIQPRYQRWSVCAQEFCFNPAHPQLISAFCGTGKVLPMWRGGGINQKLLLDFARRSASGDWCHVFPEGGIWQLPELGGRNNGKEKELGYLKWGVGKLIAHAPRKPVVIPMFHMGMETTLPQDTATKKLSTAIPRPGQNVYVMFGEEINFDDLIIEHEAQYGPLWKYHASVEEDEDVTGGKPRNFHEYWDSKPEDLILYHKITLRIEEALRKLNREYDQRLLLLAGAGGEKA